MQKIIYTGWITLDGFIAGKNGELDWVHGDEDLAAYETGIISTVDSLMLGRKTYGQFSQYWPHIRENPQAMDWEKPYGDVINSIRKIVVSKTLEKGEWEPFTLVKNISPGEIEQLKLQPGRGILIYGSASVVQQLTNLGLIDEYQLLVHPIVLGEGKRLFGQVQQPLNLQLAESRQFTSGVELLTYRIE